MEREENHENRKSTSHPYRHYNHFYHPRLRKASRGCEKWIPVRFEPDLVDYLTGSSCPVVGLENDKGAVPVEKWKAPDECILVVGNETYGIASDIRRCCEQTVCIPMFGFKGSMNLHHALAIVAQKIVENVTFEQ